MYLHPFILLLPEDDDITHALRVRLGSVARQGAVERTPKTAPQEADFLPPFHRYRDFSGKSSSVRMLKMTPKAVIPKPFTIWA
jgi:hypothetical protein